MKTEREGNLRRGNGSSESLALTDTARAEQEEHEIDQIRGRLSGLVGELDRRRHSLAPRALVKAHPVVTVITGLALLGAAIAGLLWQLRRVPARGKGW